MSADPFGGAVYVFRAKRADRIKLIFWDGTGLVLVAKRLEDGAFKWPAIADGVIRLSAAQLSALLEGLEGPSALLGLRYTVGALGDHDTPILSGRNPSASTARLSDQT